MNQFLSSIKMALNLKHTSNILDHLLRWFTADAHRFILKKLYREDHNFNLPKNDCCTDMAKGMVLAWQYYGNKCAVILFIVEESTYNICDQRGLEFEVLAMNNNIAILRYTFKNLRTCLCLKDNKLYIKDKGKNNEVALVYYRVGYSPEHYEPEDWETRLLIEQSKAIKCPSVGLHLAGTKRIQLFLTQEGVLEKFVSPEVAKNLRKVFASQYHLNMNEEGSRITDMAIKYPHLFVLKPEREGGGNNLYGLDIKNFLRNSGENRKSYILMEKIVPPGKLNCIIRGNSDPRFHTVTNELGIYGVILGNKNNIFENSVVGHLLRSKPSTVDEGGVSAGYGALDYPYLTNN